MKKLFLTVALIVCVGATTYGQSKKELQAQIETLKSQLEENRNYNYALETENRALRERIESIRKYILETTDNLPKKTYRNNNTNESPNYTPYSSTTTQSSPTSSYSGSTGRTIYTGPRGGRYYINSKGNKVYIKRK